MNPADCAGHPEKLDDTVGFCLKLIEKCDVVVFARLRGKVTAGVGREVNHALKNGKPIHELRDGDIVRRFRRVDYISRRATIALYEKYRDQFFFPS